MKNRMMANLPIFDTLHKHQFNLKPADASKKLRILDLFCCAGGAGTGYCQAVFDVIGVDIDQQPNYPFTFIQADVLTLGLSFIASFDAVHQYVIYDF